MNERLHEMRQIFTFAAMRYKNILIDSELSAQQEKRRLRAELRAKMCSNCFVMLSVRSSVQRECPVSLCIAAAPSNDDQYCSFSTSADAKQFRAPGKEHRLVRWLELNMNFLFHCVIFAMNWFCLNAMPPRRTQSVEARE